MATNYRDKAAAMADPTFNEKLAAARNSLNQNLSSLDSSKSTVRENFNLEREDTNRNNNLAKNNYSNTTLGRGLGRSTIASGGLGGFDFANNRAIGRLDMRETGELNNIESQKNILNQNFGNVQSALTADREASIQALAEQLRQRDEDVSYRNRTLAQQAAEAAASRAFQQKQFNAEQTWKQKAFDAEQAKAKNTGLTSKESQNALEAAFYDTLGSDVGQARKMLDSNKSDIISRYGASTYKSLEKDLADKEAEAEAARQEQLKSSKGFLRKSWQAINPFDGLGYSD